MNPSRFDEAASSWDEDPRKVRVAGAVAEAMLRHLPLAPGQTLLDYGAGTGLVSLALLPRVGRVVAADTSGEMLSVLGAKAARLGTDAIEAIRWELGEPYPGSARPDAAVLSMVLHHVADTAQAARLLFELLPSGGVLGAADLDLEDGSFHGPDMPVEHNGFSREELGAVFQGAGFKDVRFHEVTGMEKTGADGVARSYTIFLMTASRP